MYQPVTPSVANECKGLNAECQINNSDKNCCEGLVCGDFNEESGNGKCKAVPTPTKKPTPTPTSKPTPTPTPKVFHYHACAFDEEEGSIGKYCKLFTSNTPHESTCDSNEDCNVTPTPKPSVTPVPSLTPEPSATPEATPTPGVNTPVSGCTQNCGASNQAVSVQAPVCNTQFPVPSLVSFKADGNGSVTFGWTADSTVDKFSIIYGYSPNSLVYGANDIPGNSREFTINGLTPGHSVWAEVYAWYGQCAEISNELDPIVK